MLVIEILNGDVDSAVLVPTNIVSQTVTGGSSELVVATMEDRASETLMRRLFNALNFAKTVDDRLRVVVDQTVATPAGTAGIGYVAQQWGAQGAYPAYYASGSPNSVDERDNLRMAHRENLNDVRQGRWLIT
jgi:hypothetical protein